jgi:membrane protein implicated in regulation of membrane protease activity
MIGLFALAGLFLLRLVFGVLFVGLGLFGWLFSFAIKALIFGALIYLVIRIFSPDTARRLREKFEQQ